MITTIISRDTKGEGETYVLIVNAHLNKQEIDKIGYERDKIYEEYEGMLDIYYCTAKAIVRCGYQVTETHSFSLDYEGGE